MLRLYCMLFKITYFLPRDDSCCIHLFCLFFFFIYEAFFFCGEFPIPYFFSSLVLHYSWISFHLSVYSLVLVVLIIFSLHSGADFSSGMFREGPEGKRSNNAKSVNWQIHLWYWTGSHLHSPRKKTCTYINFHSIKSGCRNLLSQFFTETFTWGKKIHFLDGHWAY